MKLKIPDKILNLPTCIIKSHIQKIILLIVVCGSFLEISGGIWDSISHTLHEPEYFWTTQHVLVYSGVVTISISAIMGTLFLIKYKTTNIKLGLFMIIIGSMLQLASGYADSISHDIFGLDGLISIPHQILETGLALTTLGALIISYNMRRQELNILFAFSIILFIFATSWLVFNLSLLVIDTIICVPIHQIFSSGCAIL